LMGTMGGMGEIRIMRDMGIDEERGGIEGE
jgi:hypothetical protein